MTPDNLSAKDVEAAEKMFNRYYDGINFKEPLDFSKDMKDSFMSGLSAGISHARAQMEGSKGEPDESAAKFREIYEFINADTLALGAHEHPTLVRGIALDVSL